MAIEDYEKMCGAVDHRKAVTLETMPVEVEDGLLALADSYGQEEPGDD